MSDWLHNLPVPWMALVVFGFTYAVAAAIYALPVLASHIEDVPNNTTRFWVLGRNRVPPSGHDETSLVMSAANRPGAST